MSALLLGAGLGSGSSAAVASPGAPDGAIGAPAWQVVASPSLGDLDELDGVTCPSDASCWAVGDYTSGFFDGPDVQHWNRRAWTTVENPPAPAGSTYDLNGVACGGATSCWAAGRATTLAGGSETDEPLLERWDGSSWTVAPLAAAPLGQGEFYGVSCGGTSNCWAVGDQYAGDAGPNVPLLEHWDGVAWTASPAPASSGNHGFLFGVTCVNSSKCWAVGASSVDPSVGGRPLIYQLTGSSRMSVAAPSAPGDTILRAVSCTRAHSCWAVGTAEASEYSNSTVAEHYNGASWSLVPTPNPGGANDSFDAVSCESDSLCFATGAHQQSPASSEVALIERWDGDSWSLASAPPIGEGLFGTWCTYHSCWAVGAAQTLVSSETLIERYH